MATNFQDFTPEWWRDVMAPMALEYYEPAQYYSSPKGLEFGARSPRQRRYFQDSYQNVLKDFYQQEGTALREGRVPMSFMQFLDPTPDENRMDPWTARYSQLPQSARNVTGMASNPRTRFLFNY